MALLLPSAPKNFYAPSLDKLKEELELSDLGNVGQIVIITAPPVNIETAWEELKVAGNTSGSSNRGSLVVGHKNAGVITALQPMGTPEAGYDDVGYYLHLAEVNDIPIYIDGSGSTTALAIGIALIKGEDLVAEGTNDHVKYIFAITPVTVTDGGLTHMPEVTINLNYSEVLV